MAPKRMAPTMRIDHSDIEVSFALTIALMMAPMTGSH